MDTSEQYVKMCERARKIQELWVPHKGDLVARPSIYVGGEIRGHSADSIVMTWFGEEHFDGQCRDAEQENIGKVCVYYSRNWMFTMHEFPVDAVKMGNAWFYWHRKEDLIWLPYQHQSQEMLDTTWKGVWAQFIHLWNCTDKDSDYYGKFDSWEQLWLALVYKEKWNKVWVNEDWIGSNQ